MLEAEHVELSELGSLLLSVYVDSICTGAAMRACTGRERLSPAQDFLAFWEYFALYDLPLCGQALNCALSGPQEEVLCVWGMGGMGAGWVRPSCLAHLQGVEFDYGLFTFPTVRPAQIIIKVHSHYGNKNKARELAKVQLVH